jgi:hypothetical protein
MAKTEDAKKLPELVAGMVKGDKQAMETFFELIDVLEDKKLKKDGRHALMMVVSVVELLLPQAARLLYAAASDREGNKPEQENKKVPKKSGLKEKS